MLRKFIDEAMEKLIAQENWSVTESGKCAYRSEHGSCLVGHMIKDEHYYKGMENAHPSSTLVRPYLEKSLEYALSKEDMDLLISAMGNLHDSLVKKTKTPELLRQRYKKWLLEKKL